MKTLKRIDVFSAARIGGLLYFFLSLIFILPFALFMGSMGMAVGEGRGIFPFMGMGLFFLPVIYGIAGFIGSAILAWAYNLLAGWAGGLRIELEEDAYE